MNGKEIDAWSQMNIKNLILVDGMDPHLAYCEQDLVVGFSENVGVHTSSSSVNLTAEKSGGEHSGNCSLHEGNEKAESLFLPVVEDILPIKRRKRYFDSGSSYFQDQEVNFPAQRQCKLCFLCGRLQHDAKRCPKRRSCYLCKEKGHISVDCPLHVKESDRICLKCGEKGHEMLSCNTDYCISDLSKISCYACKKLGHIFCGSLVDIIPLTVSCFNCGETGHPGLQCSKPHFDKCGSQPPSRCYRGGQTCENSITVEVRDSHLTSSEQDVAVDSTSKNIEMNLTAEKQSENFCQNGLNGKVETVLLPPAVDMIRISISPSDAGGEELFEEASRYVLQQSPNENPSVSAKSKSIITENTVLRKILRRTRYFDSGDSWLEVNSPAQRQCKPCYFCGQLQHDATRCPKRRACFFCKGKGHFSLDCPVNIKGSDRICLKCGERGHEMTSCYNDYCPDDLSKIHCYACNEPGHIFCGSLIDINPQIASCFNCGVIEHPGLQCPKPHQDRYCSKPPPICYKCGEAGHRAQKCPHKQGTAGVAEGDETDLRQSRRRARRQRAYKHGRLKKQRLRESAEGLTV